MYFVHYIPAEQCMPSCCNVPAPQVFDVQMVASGEHSFQIGADEYVYAALNVYIDCINIFIEVLRIIQQLQGSED